MSMQQLLFTLLSLLTITTDAKLRGMTRRSFEGLQQRATNRKIPDDIKGKSLAELGVPKSSEAEDERSNRSLENFFDGRIFRFFAVSTSKWQQI